MKQNVMSLGEISTLVSEMICEDFLIIKVNCINIDMKSYASTDSHDHKPLIRYEDVMIHTKSKSTV